MKDFLIEFIGLYLIIEAVSLNRHGISKIKIFSKYWWIQITLIVIGVILFKHQ